ncbi:MAG TPA: ATPase, T2SS/T4P/T4SS family [Candidatus Eisenbacteria bacterium]|jgi:type IV pilus assembly protein PilB
MVSGGRKPLGQSLLEQGRLTAEELARALDEQRRSGSALRDVLLRLELVDEEAILAYYEEQLGTPRVDLTTYVLEPDVVHLIPERVARQFKLVPLFKIGSAVTIAMVDPLDIVALDEVKLATGCEVDVVVATEAQILEVVERHFPLGGGGLDQLIREHAPRGGIEGVARLEEDGPVIRFVNALIQQAVREGASDLHIEPDESNLRIRLRVDGVLREASVQSKSIHPAVVARIKVMASLDIAERRLPQDGRARLEVLGKTYDLRISTIPTIHGENVVLRILDKGSALLNIAELGLHPGPLAVLTRLIQRPNGILLVTGPTGSGKTTTLYACVNQVDSVHRNIVTLEEPVEYHLPSIRQTQVDPDVGLTFARGLRALLRQDPDVIMVGEIRDGETAEIAVRSALTGHLVLSTLHTNDAAGALPRLLDMKIEPFLLSSAMAGVVAQRLVRRACEKCRRPVTPPAETLAELGLPAGTKGFVEAPGCLACGQSGYRGRIGIFEVLELNDEIQALVSQRAPAEEIFRAARRAGMRSLREDAVRKAADGVTTLEEVFRATGRESLAQDEDPATLPARA